MCDKKSLPPNPKPDSSPTLPDGQRQPVSTGGADDPAHRQPDHPLVLLVEDDEMQAALILRLMGRCPTAHVSRHLLDGEAALDYLFRRGPFAGEKDSPRPRLVLLDLRLPKVDGLDVLRTIKESKSLHDIPVAIISTSDAGKDISLAYEYHANSYLMKPVDFQQFARMLEDTLSYWLTSNRHLTATLHSEDDSARASKTA